MLPPPLQVKKSQHKYVHGFRGQTLQELFDQTGVWVEVPPMESDVETIVLRGDAQNLGHALSLVYEKVGAPSLSTVESEASVQPFFRPVEASSGNTDEIFVNEISARMLGLYLFEVPSFCRYTR